MRLKPNHIYLIVIAILVSAGITFAQESVSPVLEGMEAEKSTTNSDYSYTDGDGSAQRVQSIPNAPITSPATTQRESVQGAKSTTATTVAKQKPTQEKQTGETQPKPEDSVLGFNFLYYIFQKYKMSDIID